MKKLLLAMAVVFSLQTTKVHGEVTRSQVEKRMEVLSSLIKKCDKKKIDAEREKVAIFTAEIFLDFADWDEKNQDKTLEAAKKSQVYKPQAEKITKRMHNFEREDCLKLVDEAIVTLEGVLSGEIKRKDILKYNLSKVDIKGRQIVDENGNPVYISSYNHNFIDKRYQEFFPDQGGFHYDFGFTTPDLKAPVAWKENEAKTRGAMKEVNPGMYFMGHNVTPRQKKAYPGLEIGGVGYTKFDIEHPYGRKNWEDILAKTVPYLKGTNHVKFGYLLTNEPHWHTAAKPWSTPVDKIDKAAKNWATGAVSKNTIALFQEWLKTQHKDIATLNKLWKSNFSSFSDVTITTPVDNHLLGGAKWYDFMKFNQYRVNRWYDYLLTAIRKHDPEAEATVKVMPNLWTENKRDHGLDFEYICNISGIVGNDCSANMKLAWGQPQWWEKDYSFNWHEIAMGFDMFKSFAPDKINFNSETHYTMNTGFNQLELSPRYSFCTYWLSSILGCNVNLTWAWTRTQDKNMNFGIGQNAASHVGSLTTQPRVFHSMNLVAMELTANGKDIAALQESRQPLRIFHSETSAINKREHMDSEFNLYKSLAFKGVALGFATEGVINKQDNKSWDVIMVANTEYVLDSEFEALQKYLDNGGIVVMDKISLVKDQYGRARSKKLEESKGKLVVVSTIEEVAKMGLSSIKDSSKTPFALKQSSATGVDGIFWRIAQSGRGRYVVSLTNLGNVDNTIEITFKGKPVKARSLFDGKTLESGTKVEPQETLFFEVGKI